MTPGVVRDGAKGAVRGVVRGGPELTGEGSPWPTPAQALLLQAAIGPDGDVESSFRRWSSLVDLDRELDGGSFRLLPLVYSRLQRLGIQDPQIGRLKGVYRQAWCQTHTLFNDLAPVIAALEAAGVRTLLLKGAPLALTYYRNHATRPMLDLDVVVPSDRIYDALKILDGLGWRPDPAAPSLATSDAHAVDVRHASGREIDVHAHPMRETAYRAADDWFWEDARFLDFNGVSTLQPSPTAMLVHLVLHGVRSNREPPFRWIADAATLIATSGGEIDWPRLAAFARTHRVSHRLHLGLQHLTLYGVAVPPRTLELLQAAGMSLTERIENLVYLGPANRLYQPTLHPIIDYWRRLRHQKASRLVWNYLGYLQRRWGLAHAWQAPLHVAGALVRRAGR